MASTAGQIPEVGQAVRVRNRLATVRAVEPYDSRTAQGRLNIVDVEYLDDFRYPEAEQLLWEVEATAKVLGKTSLPGVDANRPDSPDALQAFVNAHRWTRLNRLREGEGIEDEPLLGVWNSAIQVHPYQLEPVLEPCRCPVSACSWPMAWAWQDDPVRAGTGRTAPAAANPPHPRPLPGHAPAAVEVRAAPEVQPRFRDHRLRLDLPASPPTGHRHEPVEGVPPHHHVDGLPANARRAAAVPPGVRGRADAETNGTARRPTPRGIC